MDTIISTQNKQLRQVLEVNLQNYAAYRKNAQSGENKTLWTKLADQAAQTIELLEQELNDIKDSSDKQLKEPKTADDGRPTNQARVLSEAEMQYKSDQFQQALHNEDRDERLLPNPTQRTGYYPPN